MKLFICLLQIIIYYTNINVTFKSSNINDNDAHIWYKQDLINRKCRVRNLNEIGDEFHYLFKCHLLTDDTTTFISNRLCRNPNAYTYKNVRNTKHKKLLLAFGKFYSKVLESVKHPHD